MKEYKYDKEGAIFWTIQNPEDSKTISRPFLSGSAEYQEIIDSGVEIAPYVEPVKTPEQLRAEVIAELVALDAYPRLIEGALLGDQYSIDKLAKNEGLKIDLRKKLAAI